MLPGRLKPRRVIWSRDRHWSRIPNEALSDCSEFGPCGQKSDRGLVVLSFPSMARLIGNGAISLPEAPNWASLIILQRIHRPLPRLALKNLGQSLNPK